eukprot:TRINITY_DN1494_c0_g1_i2.p1 TRINITY_DN1494_c0_g1~~TRINITY_DN1494_c0_g1_i2.p1  ORF type:complete len:1252 (-),score=224.23 TRINITY_DN1494_c0_g1_i2:30-3785(-)
MRNYNSLISAIETELDTYKKRKVELLDTRLETIDCILNKISEMEIDIIPQKHSEYSLEQLDKEFIALQELYIEGYISENEFQQRALMLEIVLRTSGVYSIPHVDYRNKILSVSVSSYHSDKSQEKNQNIRIFLSSTFRDMQVERENIIHNTFPMLRKHCSERGLFLTGIDLRWGITNEQSQSGNTLNLCLREIDRCRPYFVCLLGNRYGWSQNRDNSDKLFSKTMEHAIPYFPFVKYYTDRSITELEVRHAVLNDTASRTAKKSLFYIKNGSSDNPKLDQLKREILSSSLSVKKYSDPRRVADLIFNDIKKSIDTDYPVKSKLTQVESQRMAHIGFEELRSKVYIGNQDYFNRIQSKINSTNRSPLIITGVSGTGKSSLVCNWVKYFRDNNPSRTILSHYIGCNPQSTDLGYMLRRIFMELKEAMGITRSIPSDLKDMVEAFPEWLGEASFKGGLVLVIDAINQLELKNNAHSLQWLPLQFPKDVHVIISSLPQTQTTNVLHSRGWDFMTVHPLRNVEVAQIITQYMSQYGKVLDQEQIKLILASIQCKNALFLRTLLEEIRLFGVYEEVTVRLKHYLQAENPSKLFQLCFERIQETYDPENSGILSGILTLIWVSRSGLSENELLSALNLTQAKWSPISLSLENSLISRSGYFTFFHDYMRSAIKDMYIDPVTEKQVRESLVLYMENNISNGNRFEEHRAMHEIPYQYQRMNNYEKLASFITDISNFKVLFLEESFKFDFYEYWRYCSNNTNLSMGEILSHNAKEYGNNITEGNINDYVELLCTIGQFFQENSLYKLAEDMFSTALDEVQQYSSDIYLSGHVYGKLGYLLRMKGDYQNSEPAYLKSLGILRRCHLEKTAEYASITNGLAILYRHKANYKQAKVLYTEALDMRKKLFGNIHTEVAQSYNSLGCLNQDMGNFTIAEDYLRLAIMQRESLLGISHPDVAMSLTNLGGLFSTCGKYNEAKEIYNRAMSIYKNIFGEKHHGVTQVYNSLAGIACDLGDYKESERLFKKAIDIIADILGEKHPDYALSLNDLASCYVQQGKLREAEPIYRKAMNLRASTIGVYHPDYAQTIYNLGSLLSEQGKFEEAEQYLNEALEINEKVFGPNHSEVGEVLKNIAGLYQRKQEFNRAIPYYNRSLDIFLESFSENHPVIGMLLNDMAILQFQCKNWIKCESLYKRSLSTYRTAFGNHHPEVAQAIINIAQYYIHRNQIEEAKEKLSEAASIYVNLEGANSTKHQECARLLETCK